MATIAKKKRVPGQGRQEKARAVPIVPIHPDRVYSENEARTLLRVGKTRIKLMRESGALPFRRDGMRWIVAGRHLLAWIEQGG